MKDLCKLFIAFFRIGLFTFGGGYAMLPMLQKEVVEKYKWATEEELMDYFAVGQCTPGVIAVNTATFVGYKQKGIMGGIIATLGVVFPSIIIITAIASVLSNFSDYPIVQHAFAGIRIVVAALVLNVVIKMYKTAVVDRLGIVIFLVSLILGLILSLSPVVYIIVSALIGVLYQKQGGFKKL
ncbi:MAG: chromate transporter [Cellulosilyticum sp.]|nr:chromate transporter [Cellulosilyticum sp.]